MRCYPRLAFRFGDCSRCSRRIKRNDKIFVIVGDKKSTVCLECSTQLRLGPWYERKNKDRILWSANDPEVTLNTFALFEGKEPAELGLVFFERLAVWVSLKVDDLKRRDKKTRDIVEDFDERIKTLSELVVKTKMKGAKEALEKTIEELKAQKEANLKTLEPEEEPQEVKDTSDIEIVN